ncbi:MAG: hypothetical protein KDC44_02550 [Phaeodactylibacter sp.]|nr:hypothetical protein [Phaeodactylibacter sp.]
MIVRIFPILAAFLLIFSACQSDKPQAAQSTATAQTAQASEGPAPSEKLILLIKDQKVGQGQAFCLDVLAQQFNQILSMQYTMHWDPKVLQFSKVDSFKLKDLSASNFGTNKVAIGNLPISWYDLDVRGLSVPDQTAIYQVCFEAIGQAGQSSTVNFDGNPVTVEISNSTGKVIPFSSRIANIEIQ